MGNGTILDLGAGCIIAKGLRDLGFRDAAEDLQNGDVGAAIDAIADGADGLIEWQIDKFIWGAITDAMPKKTLSFGGFNFR